MLKQMDNSGAFFQIRLKKIPLAKFLLFILCTASAYLPAAQNTLPLSDLSFFKSPGPAWKLAGDVNGSFVKKDVLTTAPGTGILVNLPGVNNRGKDLISNVQHGDMDMELDYMMALGSNAGIYMQGRYEIQLLSGVSTKNSGKGNKANLLNSKKDAAAKGKKEIDVKGKKDEAGQAKADAGTKKAASKLAAATAAQAPTFEDVKNLLQKNTCLACHNANTRQVGPAYKDVAKRKYTVAQIIQLIHNPKPDHWPDYSTPMPPMPQVPNEEAQKIAEWIKSLEKVK